MLMTERVAIASGLEENPRLWGLLIGDADFTHRAGDRGLVFSRNGPGLIAGRHGVNSVPLIDAATGCLSVTILEDCPRKVRQGLAEFLAEQGYLSAPKNLMVRALGSPQTFYPEGTSRICSGGGICLLPVPTNGLPPWRLLSTKPVIPFNDRLS